MIERLNKSATLLQFKFGRIEKKNYFHQKYKIDIAIFYNS